MPSVKLFAQQESRRDAVVFNNGLHGWHLDDSTEYAEHYEIKGYELFADTIISAVKSVIK